MEDRNPVGESPTSCALVLFEKPNIIFFDWEVNGRPDHVGIVEKAENGRVYTIEGNSNDEVRAKSYSLAYKCIFGYGMIN